MDIAIEIEGEELIVTTRSEFCQLPKVYVNMIRVELTIDRMEQIKVAVVVVVSTLIEPAVRQFGRVKEKTPIGLSKKWTVEIASPVLYQSGIGE